jgi:dTDP-4-amino-4,6-dideoxygalactose transaminase
VGVNSRLDSLQAAVLLTKLPHLDQWTDRRRQAAEWYREYLPAALELPRVLPGNRHVYHQFCVLTDRRDELRDFLQERGVSTAIHYPLPLNEQPAYQSSQPTPVAAEVSRRILALPMSPWLREEEVERIGRETAAFFA